MTARIKKGDLVIVVSGGDKGSQGRVLHVEADRVIIEGVNRVKKHQRPTPKNQQGGRVEKEAPVHVSNVMLLDTKSNKPTRVRIGKDKDGNKVRIAVKSGAVMDG